MQVNVGVDLTDAGETILYVATVDISFRISHMNAVFILFLHLPPLQLLRVPRIPSQIHDLFLLQLLLLSIYERIVLLSPFSIAHMYICLRLTAWN